ncbi:sensor histidine kinase [Luethyella okanaganae]|uniref:histidine kinase n=1 Tax=Luethyella okanaganae TaxID=69372 RepID=A0ABW1VEI9_9MICO
MMDVPLSPGYPASVVGGELRLPKPSGVIRQFWTRHPWLTDSLVAALYFVPSFIGNLSLGVADVAPVALALQLGAIAVTGGVLLFRRHRPWLVLGAVWAFFLIVCLWGTMEVLPILIALYALAVYRSTKAAWVGLGGSVVVATFCAYISTWINRSSLIAPSDAPAPTSGAQFATLMFTATLMLTATLIGVTVGNRRRYVNALIGRAHDLARERDQQAQLATAIERSRIARETHDIVSHSLTVMVALAEGSAATVERSPERAADAMRHVADTGRSALDDMRRMLGVLAEPVSVLPALSPQPDSAALPELVEGFQAAGMPVRLTTTGAPVSDPNLQLTIYRIVQEGLTNAFRYAATADRIDVSVDHHGDGVRVEVVDDAVSPTTPALKGGGFGLIGMRERVALYRGTLEVGPRQGRGWRLSAVLHTDDNAQERTEGTT